MEKRRAAQDLCSGCFWTQTIGNGLRYRVAAPSIRIVPWAALASCWPLPQQLLPVSATGGGRRRCALAINRGKFIYISRLSRPAELVGAKPLHLLAQTALPLKSPTGAFIAAQTRAAPNAFSQKGVVKENGKFSGGEVVSGLGLSREKVVQKHPQVFLNHKL